MNLIEYKLLKNLEITGTLSTMCNADNKYCIIFPNFGWAELTSYHLSHDFVFLTLHAGLTYSLFIKSAFDYFDSKTGLHYAFLYNANKSVFNTAPADDLCYELFFKTHGGHILKRDDNKLAYESDIKVSSGYQRIKNYHRGNILIVPKYSQVFELLCNSSDQSFKEDHERFFRIVQNISNRVI